MDRYQGEGANDDGDDGLDEVMLIELPPENPPQNGNAQPATDNSVVLYAEPGVYQPAMGQDAADHHQILPGVEVDKAALYDEAALHSMAGQSNAGLDMFDEGHLFQDDWALHGPNPEVFSDEVFSEAFTRQGPVTQQEYENFEDEDLDNNENFNPFGLDDTGAEIFRTASLRGRWLKPEVQAAADQMFADLAQEDWGFGFLEISTPKRSPEPACSAPNTPGAKQGEDPDEDTKMELGVGGGQTETVVGSQTKTAVGSQTEAAPGESIGDESMIDVDSDSTTIEDWAKIPIIQRGPKRPALPQPDEAGQSSGAPVKKSRVSKARKSRAGLVASGEQSATRRGKKRSAETLEPKTNKRKKPNGHTEMTIR